MEIRNVVIIANLWKNDSLAVAREMRTYLEQRGIECTVYEVENLDELIEISIRTDLLVSVGGDGTVLYCARLVQDLGIPILAVNLGTFGFITEISSSEWQHALQCVLDGEEKVDGLITKTSMTSAMAEQLWG